MPLFNLHIWEQVSLQPRNLHYRRLVKYPPYIFGIVSRLADTAITMLQIVPFLRLEMHSSVVAYIPGIEVVELIRSPIINR